MTNSMELLGGSVFLGVLSNAAWEVLKRAWETFSQKPLEELYVEAFQHVVDKARPRLIQYAREGEVELDRAALRQALQTDIGSSLGGVSPSAVSSESFLTRLASCMCKRSVVVIGGHNLSHHEYLQLSYNLAREAATRFADVVSRDESAFRSALVRETGQNRAAIEEIYSRLESLEAVEDRLDRIAVGPKEPRPFASPHSRLAGQRADYGRAAVRDVVETVVRSVGDARTILRPAMDSYDKPPLAPAVCAQRSGAVAQLAEVLRSVTWLALVDGPGKGKSQLARAVAELRSPPALCWVTLRGRGGIAAELHIEGQMVRWLAELKGGDRLSAGSQMRLHNLIHVAQLVSECAGEEGLLIVDDLPDPVDNRQVFEQLCWIAAGLAQNGASMLTTSQRPLPRSVMVDLGAAVHVTDAGSFTTADVLDMLESAGAQSRARTERISTLILTSTGAHPSLIAATVAWLGERGWSLDEDTLTDLLKGGPGEPVRELERRRMLRLVDQPGRDLLYRLSLVEEGFDRKLALMVSAVSTPVADPGLLLDELRGPWVEDAGDDRLEVTALLRGVGRDNLPAETQKAVHGAVAEHYLSQGTVDASQAHWLAIHLWNAKQYVRFAGVLTHLMVSAETPAQAGYILWATALMSPSMDWPDELNLDLRIMFRAAQVRTCLLAGREASVLDADLESLMSRAGAGNSAALIFGCLNAGALLPVENLDPELAFQRTLRAVRLLRQEPIVSEQDLPGRYEDIIWLAAFRLRGFAQVGQFLAELRRMPSHEHSLLFESHLACETVSHVLDSVWCQEADKPQVDQDWPAVLNLLDDAEVIARHTAALPLTVACARARAVVLADYLRKPAAALSVLEGVPESVDPDLAFLVHYTMGCVLFDAQRTGEALKRLDAARAARGDGFVGYRFHSQLYAAIAESKLGNWEGAKRRCAMVIRLANQMPEPLTYERLEMIGELAWVHWSTGRRKAACAALYGLVSSLSELDEPADPRYRETFNKAGHALGWYCSIARTGQPPSATASGDAYVPVKAGHFGVRREAIAAFTPPTGFSMAWLLTLMGALAYGVGLRSIAGTVYDAARGFARPGIADQRRVVLIDTELAALCASRGDLHRAMDLLVSAIDGVVTHGYEPDGDQTFSVTADQMREYDAAGLSPEEAIAEEYRLLTINLIGPALAGLLAASPGPDQWVAKLAELHDAISAHRHLFRDDQFAEKVLAFMTGLIELWGMETVPDEPLATAEDGFIKASWCLVASSHPNARLADSLRMQVQAVDFLLSIPDARVHLFRDLGSFLHRFWLHIAGTRGFALHSPELFRQELRRLPSQRGATTAAKVLLAACRAVGLQPPADMKSRLAAV